MPLIFPLAAALLGTALLLLQNSLSEELLLLIASTFFFGAVFNRVRPPVVVWVLAQSDELYSSLATLLELRLLRLAALLGLGRRLVALVGFLARLLPALAPLFLRPLPGTPLPLAGVSERELASTPSVLILAVRLARLRLLGSMLLDFNSLVADRLVLTPSSTP